MVTFATWSQYSVPVQDASVILKADDSAAELSREKTSEVKLIATPRYVEDCRGAFASHPLPLSRFPPYDMLILQIGKNYLDHVKEMGGSKPLAEPIWFLKPFSSIVKPGSPILLPRGVGEVHHEVELAVLIGKRAKNVRVADAAKHISGFGIALDLTARDEQVRGLWG